MVSGSITRTEGTPLFQYSTRIFNGNITIPVQVTAFEGTTYIYRGLNAPQEAVTYSCGLRCIWMWACKAAVYGESSTFYYCLITVSNVTAVSLLETRTQKEP